MTAAPGNRVAHLQFYKTRFRNNDLTSRLTAPDGRIGGGGGFRELVGSAIDHPRILLDSGRLLLSASSFRSARPTWRRYRRKLIGPSTARRVARLLPVYWLTHETNKDAMLLYDRIADRSGFLQYRKILGAFQTPAPAQRTTVVVSVLSLAL
jgi:hypothetical protein